VEFLIHILDSAMEHSGVLPIYSKLVAANQYHDRTDSLKSCSGHVPSLTVNSLPHHVIIEEYPVHQAACHQRALHHSVESHAL